MIRYFFEEAFELPNGSRIIITEFETGHYEYAYEETIEGVPVIRRRWEWHKSHGTPHVHHHYEGGYVKKAGKYGLKNVLSEIKRDFNPEFDVDATFEAIRDKS